MSATQFGRLLYTDCAAGEGLGGGAGYQVQAQSDEVDASQSASAVANLMYETQSAWATDTERQLSDFPLGFAHTAKSGYGTAQGLYLGEGVQGSRRRGNQLTDCLLTSSPEAYGPLRPAQLWDAPFWRTVAWPGTRCPSLDHIEPGPLTNDAIAEWLQAEPRRSPLLGRLVSVLEIADGKRVLIVADEPGQAMMWVAAATLLLPMRLALEIDFKVFVSNAARATQRIAAVPKELNRQVVIGSGESRFVLDATLDASDEQEISARAAFWVERLATADDPYDVVDAVELADEMGGSSSLEWADAYRAAWAATAVDEPVGDTGPLFRWLAAVPLTAVDLYGATVATRILEGDPSHKALRWIDQHITLGNLKLDPALARGKLLGIEVRLAEAGMRPAATRLAALTGDPEARRDAESIVASAILLGEDSQVDPLLRVARRHGIQLQLSPPLLDRLQRFVAGWVTQARSDYDPAEWPLHQEILDMLHSELREQLEHRGLRAVFPMVNQTWPYLRGRTSAPDDPLNWQLDAAAFYHRPSEASYQLLQRMFTDAAGATNPAAASTGIQRALLAWRAVGENEAMEIVQLVPAGAPLEQKIAQYATRAVQRYTERPTAAALAAIEALAIRNLLPSTGGLHNLLTSDRAISDFIAATSHIHTSRDVATYEHDLERLRAVDPAVVDIWMPSLLQAVLRAPVRKLGAFVLRVLAPPSPLRLIRAWAHELAGANSVLAVLCGLTWLEDRQLDTAVVNAIVNAIAGFQESLAPDVRENWIRNVQQYVPPEQARTFAELTKTGSPGKRRLGRAHGKDS
jgi:hypothetical protein